MSMWFSSNVEESKIVFLTVYFKLEDDLLALQALIHRCSLDEAIDIYLYGEITRTGSSVGLEPEELYYFFRMQ